MRVFKTISWTPILATIAPYIYIFLSMIILHSTSIYNHDPKTIGITWFYIFIFYFTSFCLLATIVGIFQLIYYLFKGKMNIISKFSIICFIIGVISFVLLHHFDPGSYINWFFD